MTSPITISFQVSEEESLSWILLLLKGGVPVTVTPTKEQLTTRIRHAYPQVRGERGEDTIPTGNKLVGRSRAPRHTKRFGSSGWELVVHLLRRGKNTMGLLREEFALKGRSPHSVDSAVTEGLKRGLFRRAGRSTLALLAGANDIPAGPEDVKDDQVTNTNP